MPNTTLDKATDFVKFRDRISLFTKKLRLAQYADGSIYDYRLKIAQTLLSITRHLRSLMNSSFDRQCVNNHQSRTCFSLMSLRIINNQ